MDPIVAIVIAVIIVVAIGFALAAAFGKSAPAQGPSAPAFDPNAPLTVVALDVETTGIDPRRGHRIVQVALIRVVSTATAPDGKKQVTFNETGRLVSLVNPERHVSRPAGRVNHITDAMLKDAPSFKSLLSEVHKLFDGAIVISHNADFDISFVAAEYALAGASEAPRMAGCFDTLAEARRRLALPDYKLATVCQALGIEQDGAHEAFADAAAALKVGIHLVLEHPVIGG